MDRAIFILVRVIWRTFFAISGPIGVGKAPLSLSLSSPSRKCSRPAETRRVVALDFSRASEYPTTSPPYTGTRREKITTITGGFWERAARETSPVAISANRGGVHVFSRPALSRRSPGTTWRYHLGRADRGAAGRLMISRCMANAANCRPRRNWARRDAAARRRRSPPRRVRVNDVLEEEEEELSRRFRSERRVL